MKSRERVIATLENKIPDRVPLFELLIDPKVINDIQPGMSYEDFVDWADLDVVTCLAMEEDTENREWVDRKNGVWRDKWGCTQVFTGEVLSVPADPPRIERSEDLNSYIPPDPADNLVIERVKKLVDRFKGERAICVVGEAVFAVSQYLRGGLENLMIDYIADPDFAKRTADVGKEYYIELYRILLEEGVEIIALGDDYAGKTGTMMSPAHFEEFIYPGLKAVVQDIKDHGGYVIKHTDGNIWGIMDLLIAAGVDVLGPLESPYMELDKIREYSGKKVGVSGNVNVDNLSRATKEEVVAETKNLLKTVSPLGGHFLSSSNSISSSVRGENYMAMIETAHSLGRYPIDTSML